MELWTTSCVGAVTWASNNLKVAVTRPDGSEGWRIARDSLPIERGFNSRAKGSTASGEAAAESGLREQEQQQEQQLEFGGEFAARGSSSSSGCKVSEPSCSWRSAAASVAYARTAAKHTTAKHKEQRDEAAGVASWLACRTLVPSVGLTATQRLEALRSRVREREAAA